MTSYLLDTNSAIALMNRSPRQVRDRFLDASGTGSTVALSAIALFELRYGAARSKRPDQVSEMIHRLLAGGMDTLPFDDGDAVRAGSIRATLAVKGRPIGPYDVLIASQAVQRGFVLVTANVKEFSRVEHLAIEDWSKAAKGRS